MTKDQELFYRIVAKINYKIAAHEGDANSRLASQSSNILFLPQSVVPILYQQKFKQLINLIEETLDSLPFLMIPVRIKGIYKKTAVKFIILLIELEDYFAELKRS